MSFAVKSEAEAFEITSASQHAAGVKQAKRPLRMVDPLLLTSKMLTGMGQYVCSVCGDIFASLNQLARHVQFHDRDRPFPCATCGKRFLSRSHHDEHQRVHTGERPYPCDRCERSFTTHHNRKRHQMIHDKEDAYRCTVCGVLFCQEHQLGNLSGIIRVLKQHESGIKIEPHSEDEQDERAKRVRTHRHQLSRSEAEYPWSGREDRCKLDISPLPIHTEARIPDALHKATGGIKKIAYDMEVTL